MNDTSGKDDELKKEIAYYKRQLDQMSGESIRYDYMIATLRQELKQKKDAFAVLTMLQQKFSVTTPVDVLLAETIKEINAKLGMDRSVVLVPASTPSSFNLSHWQGYPQNYFSTSDAREITISPSYLSAGKSILVNKNTPPDETGLAIQKNFSIIFFVGVPVIHEEKPVAFIISGRQVERLPFSPALGKPDIDTLTAVTGLISTIVQHKKTVELQVAKAEVEKENEAIAAQRDLLEKTLTELRNTQKQLVQSEKMASLGELTAGIAHEIQNPLNFVNNFSEVNKELIDEMQREMDNGNMEEVKILSSNIRANEEKINHHGKRADAIVKGMLLHSRISTGQKELTDINAVCDEYLRLAYHGFRARDKSFNATIEGDFDNSVGKINIVPQDIGRVMLNLINNAFYAANERHKREGVSHEPTVTVSTKRNGTNLLISVIDNGNGISQQILDKIFQPFFTTKPTGQGTGLGLSLAYDIVKAHGGEIKVQTREGEGTEFIVQLPAI